VRWQKNITSLYPVVPAAGNSTVKAGSAKRKEARLRGENNALELTDANRIHKKTSKRK
jgi:hypothetical protein